MINKIRNNIKKAAILGAFRAWRVIAYRIKKRVGMGWSSGKNPDQIAHKKIRWLAECELSAVSAPGAPSWHEGYEHAAHLPYHEIVLICGEGWQLLPDIKTAWDYSRFIYAPGMGASRSAACINDWLNHNPYGYGVNWFCPMEVAIRAINWIITYTLYAPEWSAECVQRVTRSLHDHMEYLERNWELADGRTSNHYLSDLVGYLYLAWFFEDTYKQRWVITQIEQEMQWQIQADGTSYEGSTAYHRLVTELFTHAKHMAEACGFSLSRSFHERLHAMYRFCADVQDIQIGDNDSGRITAYEVVERMPRHDGVRVYPQFGVAVMQRDFLYCALRAPCYHPRQPTGHFHDDEGSIVLHVRGIPLLVDPGSYVYTPSRRWRDQFRAAHTHNRLYLPNESKKRVGSDMFTITLRRHKSDFCEENNGSIHAVSWSYFLDAEYTKKVYKKVEHDALRNSIIISDTMQAYYPGALLNYTFGIGVDIERVHDEWHLYHQGALYVRMRCSIDLEPYEAWVSPSYGSKQAVIGLRGLASVPSVQTELWLV